MSNCNIFTKNCCKKTDSKIYFEETTINSNNEINIFCTRDLLLPLEDHMFVRIRPKDVKKYFQ